MTQNDQIHTIVSNLCWCYKKCTMIASRNMSLFDESVVLHKFNEFFSCFFRYGNNQGLLWVGSTGGGVCSASNSMVGNASRWGQGPGDGLVHQLVHGLEAHGALDETVDAQLVVQHPAGALAGGDHMAGGDQICVCVI